MLFVWLSAWLWLRHPDCVLSLLAAQGGYWQNKEMLRYEGAGAGHEEEGKDPSVTHLCSLLTSYWFRLLSGSCRLRHSESRRLSCRHRWIHPPQGQVELTWEHKQTFHFTAKLWKWFPQTPAACLMFKQSLPNEFVFLHWHQFYFITTDQLTKGFHSFKAESFNTKNSLN